MASPVNALSGLSATDTTKTASPAGVAPSTELFLQLLVAQIKNQDPLNPTDGVQFLSQLAEFSQLEQLIAIRSTVEAAQTAEQSDASTTPQTQVQNKE